MSRLYISWHQFHTDTQALADLLQDKGPFERIVVVARGGLAPAAILTQMMDVRLVDTLCLASYGNDHAQKDLVLLKPCQAHPLRTLVVDDLADSGKTADFVRTHLPGAHIAALYAKPLGEATLDTFVHRVPQDQWIVFPWEERSEKKNAF